MKSGKFGMRSGRHGVLDHCEDLADYGQDYLKAPQQEPLMWESDESGRKCLIGILSEKVPVGFAGGKMAGKNGEKLQGIRKLVEIVRVSQWV